MKTSAYRYFLLALLAVGTLSLSAQGLRSAYFSDSYVYRHQMNPALGNTSGYVSMPMLGNFNLGAGMNVGVKNFIYKQNDGTLTTFMNPSVSADDFLGDLEDVNRMMLDMDLQVVSVGFNAWGGYNTIEIGSHVRTGFSLPKDMFAFMKEMSSDKDYAFTDMKVRNITWADFSLGHSRQLNDAWRVGAKLKFLFGLMYANAEFNDCTARFGSNAWTMSMQGDVMLAGGGRWTTDEDGLVDGYDDFSPGVNGFGMAFDLGVTYDMKDVLDGMKLSFALTDLGWIKWDVQNAKPGGKPFRFDGFESIVLHEDDETATKKTLSTQWDELQDDLEAMYQLRPDDGTTSEASGVGMTMTLGAEYELPAYKKVSFGLLYTGRYARVIGYNEGRLNVNYAPSKAFDLSLSAAVSTYGGSLGAMANVHCPGFNLFLGTDRFYTKTMNKNMIPLESGGINVAMGINFPFGY